jgi:hypothetical protein
MADMENDFGAGDGAGEQAHDLFARVIRGTTPRTGFNADAIATAGRHRVLRNRIAGSAGGVAGVVAIALAVSAVTSGGATARPGVAASPTTAVVTPGPGRTSWGMITGAPPGSTQDMSAVLTTLTDLEKDLDPTGRHVNVIPSSYPGKVDSTGKRDAYMGLMAWTGDGNLPPQQAPVGSPPYVFITVTFLAADDTNPTNQFSVVQAEPGEPASGTPWGTHTVTHLPDHSTVDVATTDGGPAKEIMVQRTLPDGRMLVIWAADGQELDQATGKNVVVPIRPFPYTEQQLAAAAGDPALKFPFG